MDRINDTLPLRDDYVEFLELLCSAHEYVDIEPLINFFEDIQRFTYSSENQQNTHSYQWDHYKFLIQELLIYTIAVLIENGRYKEAGEFLDTEFYIKDRHGHAEYSNLKVFYDYLYSLDEYRKRRLDSNLYSITADTMAHRSTLRKYPKQKIVDADLLLYYTAVLKGHDWPWFPRLYVYGGTSNRIQVLHRLKSLRHFEKVKYLFGVNSVEELKALFKNFKHERQGYSGLHSIPNLPWQINPDEVGTLS
ncbi:hypothetical protein [Ammoniphilus resinae]|uniref:Uncharacterized protein n=1 Tax=Ammoniphilus resinae TaxID=861532 RepID=A0ABS4GNW9_9BACL|nr:hypothetical protein [Ammoniphilus resinae]MBP1931970.1 hypothetical protein [Ammoniphilus resinae]